MCTYCTRFIIFNFVIVKNVFFFVPVTFIARRRAWSFLRNWFSCLIHERTSRIKLYTIFVAEYRQHTHVPRNRTRNYWPNIIIFKMISIETRKLILKIILVCVLHSEFTNGRLPIDMYREI